MCVCVYSRLLPRGRVITRQCGNPKGTGGTYIGFVITCRWAAGQSGVIGLWGGGDEGAKAKFLAAVDEACSIQSRTPEECVLDLSSYPSSLNLPKVVT